MSKPRLFAPLVLALVIGLGVSGCGSSTSASPTGSPSTSTSASSAPASSQPAPKPTSTSANAGTYLEICNPDPLPAELTAANQGVGNTDLVMAVQDALIRLKAVTPVDSVKVDGVYSPATQAAVKSFQTDQKVDPANGNVNQATWTALGDELHKAKLCSDV